MSKIPKFTLANREYTATCVKVYDGDTAHFTFEPFAGAGVFRFICRMTGYNSAEIKGGSEEEHRAAVKARDALAGRILNKEVRLVAGNFDKYGRPLVNVFLDNENINEWMLRSGNGKPYAGCGQKNW